MFDRAAGLVVEDVGFIYISDQARPRGSSRGGATRAAGGPGAMFPYVALLLGYTSFRSFLARAITCIALIAMQELSYGAPGNILSCKYLSKCVVP